MIRFTLRCDRDHEFDGWFRSNDDFDKQRRDDVVVCPSCGSSKVEKALMAPNVGVKSNRKSVMPAAGGAPGPQMVDTLRKLRRHVEENADYVGPRFVEEARRIHYNEAESRGIYGEASVDDARELAEEGIEAYPLPRLPEDAN